MASLSLHPRAHEILSERKKVIGYNCAVNYAKLPLLIEKGRGIFLYDQDGAAYLDCVNNVCHVGHCHPKVASAGAEQLQTLNTNSRYLHPCVVEYAKRLTATMPDPLRVVFWVNSGSEANDLALRLAQAHTKKKGVICVDGAYHGHVTSIIDISPYKYERDGGIGEKKWVRKAPIPCVYSGKHRGSLDDDALGAAYAKEVELLLEDFAKVEQAHARVRAQVKALAKAASENDSTSDVAALCRDVAAFAVEEDGLSAGCGAFIMESILSCGGQIVPPKGYLQRVYESVRKQGGVCIADEVQIGFGRVGSHFWAFELQGVVPDIVTIGKPMGNGFPVAAVITTPEIARSFDNGMEYFNTFAGNPVAARVALATLDVIQEERLQDNARRVGEVLIAGFNSLYERFPFIGSVRGVGLMVGLEIVKDRTSEETRVAWQEGAAAISYAMRVRRVLLSTDGMAENIIKLKPPMIFSEADARHVITLLGDVCGRMEDTLKEYHVICEHAKARSLAMA